MVVEEVIVKYWGQIITVIGCISTAMGFCIAQIVGYMQLKSKVNGVLRSVNGLRMELKDFNETYDTDQDENIQRLSHIEGRLGIPYEKLTKKRAQHLTT